MARNQIRSTGTCIEGKVAQAPASWLSSGRPQSSQRLIVPRAAAGCGQPWAISRFSRAGRPCRACFQHETVTDASDE
jgi:hypothetical protein